MCWMTHTIIAGAVHLPICMLSATMHCNVSLDQEDPDILYSLSILQSRQQRKWSIERWAGQAVCPQVSATFCNSIAAAEGESSGLENDEIFVLTCEHSRHTQHTQHNQHTQHTQH